MEKANELAIQGGYKSPKLVGTNLGYYSDVLLDKDWWVALGKQQGWTDTDTIKIWKYNWHEFIDHIAEGKSADSFFEQILK